MFIKFIIIFAQEFSILKIGFQGKNSQEIHFGIYIYIYIYIIL